VHGAVKTVTGFVSPANKFINGTAISFARVSVPAEAEITFL